MGPRRDAGPLPPRAAERKPERRGRRRGGGRAPGAPPLPAPESPAPPRPRPRLRARPPPPHLRSSVLHSPAPRTSEPPDGPWGHLWAGSRSRGAPGEPGWPRNARPALPASGPWAAAAAPCALRNPRYALRAREEGGRLRASGRCGTDLGTPRMLAGGRAGGARRPLGAGPGARRGWRRASCWLGGSPIRTSWDGRTRWAAGRRPALLTFVERVALGLGRSEVWSYRAWVLGVAPPSGSAHCPLSPPQVAEGGPAREPLQLLEVSPRKRLTAGPEQDPCGSRPAPEGAGPGAEQGHSAGGGGWCRHCHTKLAELKRQAWKLVSGPGTPLRVSDSSSGRSPGQGPCWNLGD